MPFVRTPPVSSYKVLKTRSSWRAGNILTDSLCHGELNIIQPNTATKSPTTLVARAYREMQTMVAAGSEIWLGKVVSMKQLLDFETMDHFMTCFTYTSEPEKDWITINSVKNYVIKKAKAVEMRVKERNCII